MGRPIGPREVHRYSIEFKIQAVKLALHPDIQTQDVPHALISTRSCSRSGRRTAARRFAPRDTWQNRSVRRHEATAVAPSRAWA